MQASMVAPRAHDPSPPRSSISGIELSMPGQGAFLPPPSLSRDPGIETCMLGHEASIAWDRAFARVHRAFARVHRAFACAGSSLRSRGIEPWILGMQGTV